MLNTSAKTENFTSHHDVTKACTQCHEIKKLTEFYTDSRASDGRESQCRKCKVARRKDERGEKRFDGDFVTQNCPCEGCIHNSQCLSKGMSCASFDRWVSDGKVNEIPRIPDRYHDEC